MREKENCLILLMCWEIQIGVVHMMQMQDILGEGNGNPLQHSCWKIPWMEKPDTLQSMGSQRVGHD